MSAILSDAPSHDDASDDFDVGEALLAQWKVDAPKPSDAADEEDTRRRAPPREKEDDDEDTESDTDESVRKDQDDEEEDDESNDEKDKNDEDFLDEESLDVKVKHKVDGEDREFSVRDLLRLAGQEASLTRKSQEVATTRTKLNEIAASQLAAYDALVTRARTRWEPFSKINYLALSKDPNITAEDLTAIQQQAEAAHADLHFLESGMSQFSKNIQKQRQDELLEQAKECVKVLTSDDPNTGIKGWSDKTYADIRDYATKRGVNPAMFDQIVDPAAFRIMHDAMMFARGKAQVSSDKKSKEAARTKAPKKIVKGTTTASAQRANGSKADKAMKQLQRTGSVDDASAALLALWGSDE